MAFLTVSANSAVVNNTYIELLAKKREFQPIDPAVNYTVTAFSNFTFFGSALENVNTTINRILDTWPINFATVSAATTAIDLAQKYYDVIYTPWERNIVDGFSISSCTGTSTASKTVTWPNIRRDINNDLIITEDSNWVSYLQEKATEFDELNDNTLKKFIPQYYLDVDDTDKPLELFLNSIGRFFDEIKSFIDQMEYMFNIDYSTYNRIPDGAQKLMLRNMGFNLISGFLTESIVNYFTSANDIPPLAVETGLWKRVLNNLIYIYKTRGARESVNALLNCLGVPSSFIHIDEYTNYKSPISVTGTVSGETYSLKMNNDPGTNFEYLSPLNSTVASSFEFTNAEDFTFEMQFVSSSASTEQLFGIKDIFEVRIGQDDPAPNVGHASLILSGGDYSVNTSTATMFDGRVVHCFLRRDVTAASATYDVFLKTKADTLSADVLSVSTSIESVPSLAQEGSFAIGAQASSTANATFGFNGKVIDFRLYTGLAMREIDMDDHVLFPNTTSISGGRGSTLTHQYKFNEPLDTTWRDGTISGFDSSNTATYVIRNSKNKNLNLIASNFSNGNHHEKLENVYVIVRDTLVGKQPNNNRIYFGEKSEDIQTLKEITIHFKPIKAINDDIEDFFGPLNASELIGDPRYSKLAYYDSLKQLANVYFNRFDEPYTFKRFLDLVETVGVYLTKNIKSNFLPARAKVTGEGIVVESHLLERSKRKQETVTGSELSLDEHNQVGLDNINSKQFGFFKPSTTAVLESSKNYVQIKSDIQTKFSDTKPLKTRSTDDFTTISGTEVYDRTIRRATKFKTKLSSEGDFVSPLLTEVIDSAGYIFRVEGKDTIRLAPRTLSSDPLSLKLIVEDKNGTQVIGQEIKITQEYKNTYTFNITDVENNLPFKTQTSNYLIKDMNGLDLSCQYNKDIDMSKLSFEQDVISGLVTETELKIQLPSIIIDDQIYKVFIKYPYIGNIINDVTLNQEVKTAFSPTMHILDDNYYIYLGVVDTDASTKKGYTILNNTSNKVPLNMTISFNSPWSGCFKIKDENEAETYLEGRVGTFDRRLDVETSEKYTVNFDRKFASDSLSALLAVTGLMEIKSNDLLNKSDEIPIFTSSLSSEPWILAEWSEKHQEYTDNYLDFGIVDHGSTGSRSVRLINVGGYGITGVNYTDGSLYGFLKLMFYDDNTKPLHVLQQDNWERFIDTGFSPQRVYALRNSSTADLYPGNSNVLTVISGTSGEIRAFANPGSYSGNLTATVQHISTLTLSNEWVTKTIIPWKLRINPVSGITWVKQAGSSAVFDVAAATAFDSRYVSEPTVFSVTGNGEERLYMLYSGISGSVGAKIGAASSIDGITWIRLNGGSAVFESTGNSNDFDGFSVHTPSLHYDNTNNIFWMWYSGLTAVNTSSYKIGAATSSDLITWTRMNSGEPVLTASNVSNSFDKYYVKSPSVIKRDNVYEMVYAGQNNDDVTQVEQIGAVTSSDGITWARINNGVPVIKERTGWSDGDVNGPSMVYNNDYHVWYNEDSSAGISYSKGPSLSKLEKVIDGQPVLPQGAVGSGLFDSIVASHPIVILASSGTVTYRMWYTGSDGTNERIGYALSY